MESGMRDKNRKGWITWCLDKRYRKRMIATVISIFLLVAVLITLLRPGNKMWYMLSVQESFTIHHLKAGEFCTEVKELEKRSPEDIYGLGDGYPNALAGLHSKVFEQDLKFILYGKIERIKNYAVEGENMRDGKKVHPVPYYCHVITVQVKRNICGGLRKNQRVNLLCRWKYEERDRCTESDWEYLKQGKNALFLVGGRVAKIQDQETGESIDILGRVPHERGSRLIACKKFMDLDKIGSKDEALSYYKKHRIVE